VFLVGPLSCMFVSRHSPFRCPFVNHGCSLEGARLCACVCVWGGGGFFLSGWAGVGVFLALEQDELVLSICWGPVLRSVGFPVVFFPLGFVPAFPTHSTPPSMVWACLGLFPECSA
jgi:hypothetical protein